MPNFIHAGTYSAVTTYLKAVQAANTDAPAKVMQQLKATPINDMFARNGRIREDGRKVHELYLVQVKKPAEIKGHLGLLCSQGDRAWRGSVPAADLCVPKTSFMNGETKMARTNQRNPITRSAYAIRSPSQRDEVFGTHTRRPTSESSEPSSEGSKGGAPQSL